MPTLADQIRDHIGVAREPSNRALLAVLDECQQGASRPA